VAYAIYLTVTCLYYSINDENNLGSADKVYDKVLCYMQQMSDEHFTKLLGWLLKCYVQLFTTSWPWSPLTFSLDRLGSTVSPPTPARLQLPPQAAAEGSSGGTTSIASIASVAAMADAGHSGGGRCCSSNLTRS
jgi:hypothetical protein